jgi:hypothetical protein
VQAPVWSVGALVELVVPLAITVLVVQNGQGVAVLGAAMHQPPVNTIAFGVGHRRGCSARWWARSAAASPGPPTRSSPRRASIIAITRRPSPSASFGVLFGLLAPTFTRLMLAAPKAFIMVLGGLAMLRVLQGAFVASFGGGKFTLGGPDQPAGHRGRPRAVQHRRRFLGPAGRLRRIVVDGKAPISSRPRQPDLGIRACGRARLDAGRCAF